MNHITQHYLEQLKEYNPVEKDGVITFNIQNQTIQFYPRTGWFTGMHVRQGFGIIELKKRIEQCQQQQNTNFGKTHTAPTPAHHFPPKFGPIVTAANMMSS